MKFSELNLSEELIAGLSDIRFEEPTPVQEKSIPHVLDGKDIIATAQTGTGKTGAFVIPIIERILRGKRGGIKAIILTPTRELAQQIDEQIFALGYHTGITSATVIGGSDFSAQAKALKAGVDIVVATPGRFIDQYKVVNIDLSSVEYLVLDEADRMLDMGFMPDMKKIISWLPPKRQTLLFSATMPKEIERLAASIMKNPVTVEIARSKPSQRVEQRVYFLKSDQKIPLIRKIFDEIKWDSCIIFTSTKKGTDELQRLLKSKGIKAGSIHGDRSQEERNRSLNAFKNGEIPVIVATNVLARGIDIKDVSMIVNYDVPHNADDYIHRIGRTGRYDQTGIAVTFVTQRDRKAFSEIENIRDNPMKKITVPDAFGDSSPFSWDNAEEVWKDLKSSGRQPDREKREERREARDGHQDREGRGGREARESREGGRDGRMAKGERESRSDRDQESRDRSTPAERSRGGSGDRSRGGAGEREESGRQKKESSRSTAAHERSRTDRGRGRSDSSDGAHSGRGRQKTEPTVTPQKAAVELPVPVRIEKATERNRYRRKPAKGVWGIIKSVVPKIRPN